MEEHKPAAPGRPGPCQPTSRLAAIAVLMIGRVGVGLVRASKPGSKPGTPPFSRALPLTASARRLPARRPAGALSCVRMLPKCFLYAAPATEALRRPEEQANARASDDGSGARQGPTRSFIPSTRPSILSITGRTSKTRTSSSAPTAPATAPSPSAARARARTRRRTRSSWT